MTDTSQPGPAERLLMEKGWTQGGEARDKNGLRINVTDQDAVSYCVLGAMYIAYPNEKKRNIGLSKLKKTISQPILLSMWSDEPARTKEEVCAALRKAGNL